MVHKGILNCLKSFLGRTGGYEDREWGQREDLMLSALCFQAGESWYQKGNELCEKIKPEFCIYSTLPALQLLMGQKEHLSESAVSKLEQLLLDGQERYEEELKKEKKNSFHLISIAAIAGWGLYSSEPDRILHAGKALEEFRQYCMHYDAPDEYVAPFYSGLQLAALAILAELIPDTDEGEAACALENYVWRSLLERCHPRLGALAGPYSRGYLSEMCGHPQAVLGALEAVLGAQGPFSMERMLWTEENSSRILPHGSLDCTRLHALYFAMVDYHCDPDLIRHWRSREYPCRSLIHTHTDGSYDVSIRKKVETERPFDYPAADAEQQIVFGRNYALGTADIEYENGMACNSFSFLYGKAGYPRTCFTKLTVDGKYIGEWNTFSGIGMHLAECNFPDEGRKTVEETADGWLIRYRPRGFCRDAHEIKLFFAIPEHFGAVDAVLLDGKVLDGEAFEKELSLKTLEIQDGEFRYSLRPLEADGYWVVLRRNHYLCLEWHKEMADVETMMWEVLFRLEAPGNTEDDRYVFEA